MYFTSGGPLLRRAGSNKIAEAARHLAHWKHLSFLQSYWDIGLLVINSASTLSYCASFRLVFLLLSQHRGQTSKLAAVEVGAELGMILQFSCHSLSLCCMAGG